MGEREVRERSSRTEARIDVVDRLIDEAMPTRMIGAGIGDAPPWFTLLLVPVTANLTSRTIPTSTTAALREPRQASGVALLCGHALLA
jgi:hypothetical protein